MTNPSISVVMATLDAEPFLEESLESIVRQSLPPSEILIVDGGSTDRTLEIAGRFPAVRVLRQRGVGFAGAWNDGIREARGAAIALLDSDDRWTPGKLLAQWNRLQSAPRVEAVLGYVRFFVTGEAPPHFKHELLDRPVPAHMPGALLAAREVFERVGLFEERWAIASDVDWFARLNDAALPVAVLDDVVLEKRVHSANLSYTAARTPLVRREILAALRESARRKRGERP